MASTELNHHLRIQPYPYQVEGIKYGLEKRRLFIGDEPGLGKTLQSIGIVDTANAYPCLVICPSSLKINWQREFEKFTDKIALVLDNSTRTTWSYLLQMGMHHVAIVNYESLRKYFVWDIKGGKNFRLKDVVFCPQIKQFRSVIIDESHRVKDPSAQQTIFTKGICTGKDWVIMLSGTPVVNRPEDLVAQLSIMGRLNEFGGKSQFLAEYGEGENLSTLSQRLYSKCMIRREKAKVLTQLPPKTRCDLYVDISNREEYDLAANDLAEYLRTYKECTDHEIRLLALLNVVKGDACIDAHELVKRTVQNSIEHSTVVFFEVGAILCNRCLLLLLFHGSTTTLFLLSTLLYCKLVAELLELIRNGVFLRWVYIRLHRCEVGAYLVEHLCEWATLVVHLLDSLACLLDE
jgi:SNF2 family DNA or RNA helicase